MANEVDKARGETAGGSVLRARIFGRLLLVIGIGLVFLTLSGTRLIDPTIGLVAYGIVVLLAVFTPDAREPVEEPDDLRRSGQTGFADAVRCLADALPDPCIVIDRRSIVVHVNPVARRHFPAIVSSAPIAYSLRSPPLFDAIEAARNGGTQRVELHQTVPTETWYKVTVAPLAAGDPDNDGVLVITLQSLTEERRLESLRSDFIANASHELRTPLTSLVGFIDTLLGPAANDKVAREKFLTLMRGQALRMSKLVDDLMSLSRIEMRQHLRPTKPVDLGVLVREVVEGLGPVARDAGVELKVELPAEPQVIPGERDELYEVVENLVDNAIKYGADGKAVEIAVAPAGKPGFDILLSITDHGPGVAEEHVPRLTERFYRVDAESSRKKKGTGLGLAIVKHIVSRHQGLMTIRSRPGEGMRVEILLRK